MKWSDICPSAATVGPFFWENGHQQQLAGASAHLQKTRQKNMPAVENYDNYKRYEQMRKNAIQKLPASPLSSAPKVDCVA